MHTDTITYDEKGFLLFSDHCDQRPGYKLIHYNYILKYIGTNGNLYIENTDSISSSV